MVNVNEIVEFMAHPWQDVGMAVVIFSLVPDFVLRLFVLIYPRGEDRRKELIGELARRPRWERPFWVAEHLAMIVTEGCGERVRACRADRDHDANHIIFDPSYHLLRLFLLLYPKNHERSLELRIECHFVSGRVRWFWVCEQIPFIVVDARRTRTCERH